MDVLLLLGLILVSVFGVHHIIKMQRLVNSRAQLKQESLEKAGRILAWTGSISAVGLPRLFGVRYKYDNPSTLIASALYAVGFIVMFIGFKFRLAAYKTKEETPAWISRALTLWSSFWGDNTD